MATLTPAEFDLWWTVVMIGVEVGFAALFIWPFVTDYRRACHQVDDLMDVADAVFGPDMERIP